MGSGLVFWDEQVDGMDAFTVKQACKFAKEYALKNGPIVRNDEPEKLKEDHCLRTEQGDCNQKATTSLCRNNQACNDDTLIYFSFMFLTPFIEFINIYIINVSSSSVI